VWGVMRLKHEIVGASFNFCYWSHCPKVQRWRYNLYWKLGLNDFHPCFLSDRASNAFRFRSWMVQYFKVGLDVLYIHHPPSSSDVRALANREWTMKWTYSRAVLSWAIGSIVKLATMKEPNDYEKMCAVMTPKSSTLNKSIVHATPSTSGNR
jgi:hypothetical protein